MTISSTYDRYLSHFKETVTLRDFNQRSDTPGLCGLRHDVDHDLDLALEMAHKEHQLGIKASYFILPSAPYWQADKQLLDKCLQLQDYGHEVGLHVNSMAEWVSGVTDDITASLTQQINFLRHAGIDLTGIAAHGDKLCYEHNLSNYWCFEELRPESPYTVENGRTAEGPHEADLTPRLQYPVDHLARRPDGSTFPLWSVSMHSLALDYHAWHTKFDHYFSDSGGGWKRTSDPIDSTRNHNRWQVLIHPEHWRGPKKLYFFLSTARSGSRWLADVLDTATSVTARHEYMLNQNFHRGETLHKPTAAFRELEDNSRLVKESLIEAWEEFELQKKDYAEVNVYLATFTKKLRLYFPDAEFVHLHRDPADVVRSLMNRDWYDTPEDYSHPSLKIADAKKLSQFERVCYYVAETNEQLLDICDTQISFENLVQNSALLEKELKKLGIPFHPRLGARLTDTIINASANHSFPDSENWSETQIRQFKHICGRVLHVLKYREHTKLSSQTRLFEKSLDFKNVILGKIKKLKPKIDKNLQVKPENFSCVKCIVKKQNKVLTIQPLSETSHAYIMLFGGGWNERSRFHKINRSGYKVSKGRYIQGICEVNKTLDRPMSIFAINYGSNRKVIYRRRLGTIDKTHSKMKFSFSPHPDAVAFDIAFHIPASGNITSIDIEDLAIYYRN